MSELIGLLKTGVEFGTFYFLFWWVMCILYKDNWFPNLLNNIGLWIQTKTGPKTIGKIIHSIGQCHFCMESHTATLLAIGYSCYWLDPHYLYWGFLCAAINRWLRTFINR